VDGKTPQFRKRENAKKNLSVFLYKNYDYKMLNINYKSGSKHYNLPIKAGLIGTARKGFSMISNLTT
jgi:hypothetical protein